MLAGIVYRDDRNKDRHIPVELIFKSKSDEKPISPKDEYDFRPTTNYYVLWCRCSNSAGVCSNQESCQKYKKSFMVAQIFGLAGKLHYIYFLKRKN